MEKLIHISRQLIVIVVLALLLGHTICVHSHVEDDFSPGIETTNELSELLKKIFFVNLGDGHLENYRIEKKFCDTHFIFLSPDSLWQLSITKSILPEPKEISICQEQNASPATIIHLQVIKSVTPLRGSPIYS